MSLAFRIVSNTFYQILGKIASTVLGLIAVAIMTRYLGQTGFGYYTTIVTFLQFFAVLIDFGLQMTAATLLGRPGADQQKIFNNIFTLRLVSALLLLGSAAGLVWLLPYPGIVKVGTLIASVSFLFIALQSVIISLYQKNFNLARVAIAEVWGRAILVLGTWLATLYATSFEQGLLLMIGAVVAGSLVNCSLLFASARRYVRVRLAWDWGVWRDIWTTSWPIALTIALTLVYFRADTLILSLMRPPEEVGIYGATYKVLDILVQFPYLFLGMLLPLLSNFFVSNRQLFATTLQKSFDFLLIIILPMIVGTIILGRPIMVFVAGQDFAVSGDIIKVLILAAGIIYVGALFGYGIVAAGAQKRMIKYYAVTAVAGLIAYVALIPIYSYWAAAWLTVATELAITLAAWWVLRRESGFSPSLRAAPKALLASAIMGGIVYALAGTPVVTVTIVGALVYGSVLVALGGLSWRSALELIKMRSI